MLSLQRTNSNKMENKEENTRLELLGKVAKMVLGTPYTPEQLGVVQRSVAKNTTPVELAFFLNTCQSVGLNPFNKEVWCYKDNSGNLIIFTGRDGLLRKAQENAAFNGIRSSEVRENDVFSMDVANAKIEHTYGTKDRGAIIGAYAIVFRKEGEPTIEWVRYSDFAPKNPNAYSPWKRFSAAMIKKCAESHALKKAFGMGSVQIEYDFEVVNDKAIPKGERSEKKKSAEWEQINRFINEATGEELVNMDLTILDKFPDLSEKHSLRVDELMTKDISADEV